VRWVESSCVISLSMSPGSSVSPLRPHNQQHCPGGAVAIERRGSLAHSGNDIPETRPNSEIARQGGGDRHSLNALLPNIGMRRFPASVAAVRCGSYIALLSRLIRGGWPRGGSTRSELLPTPTIPIQRRHGPRRGLTRAVRTGEALARERHGEWQSVARVSAKKRALGRCMHQPNRKSAALWRRRRRNRRSRNSAAHASGQPS
jgi:hypothetical protein